MGRTGGGRRWGPRIVATALAILAAVVSVAAPASAARELTQTMLVDLDGFESVQAGAVSEEELEDSGVTLEGEGRLIAFQRLFARESDQTVVHLFVMQLADAAGARQSVDSAMDGASAAPSFDVPIEGARGWHIGDEGVTTTVIAASIDEVMVTVAASSAGGPADDLAVDVTRRQLAALPEIQAVTLPLAAIGGGLLALAVVAAVAILVVRRARGPRAVAAPAVGAFGTGLDPAPWPAGTPRPAPAPTTPRAGPTPAGDRPRAWFDTPLPPAPPPAPPPPPQPLPPSRTEPVELPADPDWWRKRRFEPHFEGVHRLNEGDEDPDQGAPTPAPEPVRGSPPVSATPVASAPIASAPIASAPIAAPVTPPVEAEPSNPITRPVDPAPAERASSGPLDDWRPKPQRWAPPTDLSGVTDDRSSEADATARFAAKPAPPVDPERTDKLSSMLDRLLASADDDG